MDLRHELRPAWRCIPWASEGSPDGPPTAAGTARGLRPLALSVAFGLLLGTTIAAGLARDDRVRLDLLLASAAPR